MPVDVFLSYSSNDESLRDELETHLALLESQGIIRKWSARQIDAGDDWRDRVSEQLDGAHIILLLVSADFLASPYCRDVEMARAMQRHHAGEARVIPVVLRACDLRGAPFEGLLVLPADSKPVKSWTDRDEAWTNVAAGIRSVAEHFLRGAGGPAVEGSLSPARAEGYRGPTPAAAFKGTPAPHNLPVRRLFVGREKELSILDATLAQKQRASLFALPGTGKTALALEYAHRAIETRAYPGGVWWILAEGQPLEAMIKLASALRASAPALLAHVRLEAPAEEQVEAARIALQNHPSPSLLVLDNVSEPGLLERLPGGAVRVLATVRDRRLSVGETVQLEPLDPGEARALVDALTGAPEWDAEADACDQVIHRELGGLAVAVEVAARAAKEWAGGWVAYQGYLAIQMTEVLDDARDRSEHYPRGVFAALDLSIDQCPPRSPERNVLAGAAALAPDGLPLAWAYAVAEITADSVAGKRALARLQGLGLVKVDWVAATLSMHRLLHRRVKEKVIRWEWEAGKEYTSRRCGVDYVAAWMVSAVGRTRTQMEEIDMRRAHIEEALHVAERGMLLPWAEIANQLARHLRYCGRYEESQALSHRMLKKMLPRLELEQIAVSLSSLALALQALGEARKARSLLEHALAITEETYGSDHAIVASSLSNLARVLPDIGEAARARSLLEHALVITEKTYGSDHINVATSLSNLAGVLVHLGEPVDARPLLERALAIAEKTHGTDGSRLSTVLSNLATVLRDLGEVDRARPLLERSLAINETTYGPDHPQMARSLSNLAGVLQELGEAGKARPLLERALAINVKILGDDHPELATSLSKLAGVLLELGAADEAQRMFRHARRQEQRLQEYSRLSGEEKLKIEMMSTAADEHEETRKQKQNERLMVVREFALERAVAIAEEIYGPDHPVVSAILLSFCEKLGYSETVKARPLLERSLAIFEKSDNSEHPDMAKNLMELAGLLQKFGETAKARPLLERELAIAEKTYGPDHPEVAWRLNDLASVLKKIGETDKARSLLDRLRTRGSRPRT